MLKNQREEQRELILTAQTQIVGDFLEISIIDIGPGIFPDELQHIFEPFYSTKTFGVGLGLPIVKKIIEQHGGVVEITSEEEKGTKVTLRMSIKPQTSFVESQKEVRQQKKI